MNKVCIILEYCSWNSESFSKIFVIHSFWFMLHWKFWKSRIQIHVVLFILNIVTYPGDCPLLENTEPSFLFIAFILFLALCYQLSSLLFEGFCLFFHISSVATAPWGCSGARNIAVGSSPSFMLLYHLENVLVFIKEIWISINQIVVNLTSKFYIF